MKEENFILKDASEFHDILKKVPIPVKEGIVLPTKEEIVLSTKEIIVPQKRTHN